MTAPIVVIGDVLIDELLRQDEVASRVPGGSALNVAVGLRILGHQATLVCTLGDDEDGQAIRNYAREWGVELIPTINPLGTGRATSRRVDGEPSYSFNDAAKERTIPFDASLRDMIATAAAFAISGFPFDRNTQIDGLATCREGLGVPLAIDPNPRIGLVHNARAFRHNLEHLSSTAALVKIGDDDTALLYETGADSIAQRFIALGTQVVLSTHGSRGASIRTATTLLSEPPANRPEPIVDTMGAGDATFATVLGAMASPGPPDWRQALREAMAIAGGTIRQAGPLLRTP